jgi:ribosomal protein S18 acetylase RimI-like enzyme
MCYRRSGNRPPLSKGVTFAQANKRDLKALVDAGEFIGLIAYQGRTPVGWLSLGPRDGYAKLRRSPVMRPVDDQPVWSIICFVVPGEWRGQGVARALLDGAIAFARRRKVRLLEAYPVDKAARSSDDAMWFGAKSMFDAAGFQEVARRKPARPVVRIRPV